MNHEVPKIFTKEWSEFIKINEENFQKIERKHFTKDGLLPCKYLKKSNNNFWFNDVRVSPNNSSISVANYLYKKTTYGRTQVYEL